MNDDSPFDISILSRHSGYEVDQLLLHNSVEATLRHFGHSHATVSVAIVTDQEISDLHERYRQSSGPTDVLAFDLSDPQTARSAVEGEIVVSADTAERQAKLRGHSPDAELALYAVHGTLHLLGMRDDQPAEADRMHRIEDEILSVVGIGPVYGG